NNTALFRMRLTCDSLFGSSWSYEFGDYEYDAGYRSELERYEDTGNNVIRIAVPYEEHLPGSNNWIQVALVDLDYNTGNYVPGSRKTLEMPNDVNNAMTFVHGLEFTPDGNGLYVSHAINSNFSSPLSFYNVTTETLTNLNYTNIVDFQYSQLQVSGDSGNYFLIMASENYLGSLSNPNVPNGSYWNSTSVPLNNYPINNANYSNYSLGDRKRLIPDQIDYEDYIQTML